MSGATFLWDCVYVSFKLRPVTASVTMQNYPWRDEYLSGVKEVEGHKTFVLHLQMTNTNNVTYDIQVQTWSQECALYIRAALTLLMAAWFASEIIYLFSVALFEWSSKHFFWCLIRWCVWPKIVYCTSFLQTNAHSTQTPPPSFHRTVTMSSELLIFAEVFQ